MTARRRGRRLFRFDERLRPGGRDLLAGIDEAGRGPLAGPVVAAAVIFPRETFLPGLDDSKKLLPKFRKEVFWQIIAHATVGMGCVSEEVIDQINILQATRLAMRQAVLALSRTPQLLLIDGRIHLDLPLPQIGIVRGDDQSAAIAAASIVAKVYRDALMEEFDGVYPDYGFASHKGYPTRSHLLILRQRGATALHRKTFRPVAEAFCDSRR